MNLTSSRIKDNKMKFLPTNYELGEFDVICGRGNDSYTHKGNQWFRELIVSQLQRFKGCGSKWEKSKIISDVIDRVRFLSGNGGFIRLDMDSWRYYQISDVIAREKVSQAFRAAIYEESKKSQSLNRKFSLLPNHCKRSSDGHYHNNCLMETPIMPLPNCVGSDLKIVRCHQVVNDKILCLMRGGIHNMSDKKEIVVSQVVSSAEECDLNSTPFSVLDKDAYTQIPDGFHQNVSIFANPGSQGIDHSVSHGFQTHISYMNDDEGFFNALMELSNVVEVHDDLSDSFDPLPF